MTVIMHYLFLAVFCWMLCEGILLYLMLIVVFKSNKSYSKHFFCLGWGLPLVVVAISFGVRFDLYGDSDYCFLTQHSGLIYAFVGPMAAILLVRAVVVVVVFVDFAVVVVVVVLVALNDKYYDISRRTS
jgi:hypothetical protein